MIKSMLLYRIIDPKHVQLLGDSEALAEVLAEKPARMPEGSQWGCSGFDKPAPSVNDDLVWPWGQNSTMFTVYFHERQLPGATIRDHLNERIHKIEERESRKCYRKEIAQMKDDVIAMLLPRAFIKHTAVNLIVKDDLLVVGCSSAKRSEDCLDVLRSAIGSLSVRPLTLKLPADSWLTDLMRAGAHEGLNVREAAKLVNVTKDAVVFKGCDLSEDEPQAYLDQGFHVAEIDLSYEDSFFFRVTDQLIFKGMKFSDIAVDNLTNDAQGDPASLIDANLILLLEEVGNIIGAMQRIAGEDVIEHKLPEGERDLIAETAQLLTSTGRVSVNLIVRNLGCDAEDARRLLLTLADDGLLEVDKSGNFKLRDNAKYVAPNARPDGLADEPESQAVDEFGDPIKHPAELADDQKDDDL